MLFAEITNTCVYQYIYIVCTQGEIHSFCGIIYKYLLFQHSFNWSTYQTKLKINLYKLCILLLYLLAMGKITLSLDTTGSLHTTKLSPCFKYLQQDRRFNIPP